MQTKGLEIGTCAACAESMFSEVLAPLRFGQTSMQKFQGTLGWKIL
jgi:hypothetical protein